MYHKSRAATSVIRPIQRAGWNLRCGQIATIARSPYPKSKRRRLSLSDLAAGVIVEHFRYSTAFHIGRGARQILVALVDFVLGVAETADRETVSPLN